jgi:hypothetical protein
MSSVQRSFEQESGMTRALAIESSADFSRIHIRYYMFMHHDKINNYFFSLDAICSSFSTIVQRRPVLFNFKGESLSIIYDISVYISQQAFK